MRTFPLAGDTDNDATYHDDYVAEDVPAAEPPVASPAQIQSKLSSFSMPASTSSVVSQLVALSAEDLKAFAKSRTTLHYELVIPKLTCLQNALTERFEAMRIEEAAKASAASPRVKLQMLLSSLPPPQQMPAPTEGMQSVLVEDSLQPEPVAAVQIATPVQVEEEGAPAPARVAKPSGGQIGPRKQYGEATRASKRTAAAAPSPPPPKRSLRHAETNAEPTDERPIGMSRAAAAAKAKQAQRKYEEMYRTKAR